jgi:hypothetical protein
MMMNVSFLKATFKLKEPYIVLKGRGQLLIEMIPMSVNQMEPTKKILNPKDRFYGLLQSDAVYALLHDKNTKFLFKKDSDTYEISTSDRVNEWEWTIVKNSNLDTKRVIIMNKVERFMAQEFIKYSIPFIQGWYAVGDSRIAEQNMINDPEIKDPFENI